MAMDSKDMGVRSTVMAPLSSRSGEATLPADLSLHGSDGPDPFRTVDPADFHLSADIAHGGMGRVRRARDRRLGRDVAIKELLASTPDRLERFAREVKLTARLEHPAIVTIHEAGRWPDGKPFYAMKVVNGRPLDRVIAEARTPQERLALLPRLLTVVEALAYAHGQRVIHRDLKPSNVLCGEFGETVVIDWGLAKDLAAPATESLAPTTSPISPVSPIFRDDTPTRSLETQVGAVLGTPSYMPPEQAHGRRVDERADVYALGALLYHVLAGAPPYAEPSAAEVIAAVQARPPPPLEERAPDVPPELLAIVRRAMARDPAGRYPSAKEMADDLRSFQTGQLVGSHRYTPWQLLGRWARRHRAVLGAGAAAAIAAGVVGVLALRSVYRAQQQKVHAEEANADLEQQEEQAAEDRAQKDRADYLAALKSQALDALAVGDDMQAAAYLVPVYTENQADPGVRFMVARAMATIDPLDRVLVGHTAAVRAAAFSPDGARVITASKDGTVRVWDVATGASVLALKGLNGGVLAAGFSPDGARIVTTDEGGDVRVWDARSGAPVLAFSVTPNVARSAIFAPDGSQILVASQEGKVTLHDGRSGQELTSIDVGHTVSQIAFSPDGARVVTAERDLMARVWDLRARTAVLTLAGHAGPVTSAAYSRDGRWIVTGSEDKTVKVWDAATGALMATAAAGQDMVKTVVFCQDDARVVAAYEDGSVGLLDAPTLSPVGRLEGHVGRVNAASCSVQGGRIVTAGDDGTARLWTFPSSAALPVIKAGTAYVVAATYSGDGRRVATADYDGVAGLWDAHTGAALGTFVTGPVASATFDAAGGRLVTTSPDGAATEWEIAGGARLLVIHSPSADELLHVATFDPNGRAFLAGGDGGQASLWDSSSGTRVAPLGSGALTGSLFAAAFSSDGRWTALGNDAGRVWILGNDGKVVAAVTSSGGGIEESLAFSPDGSCLAATDGKVVWLWNPSTGAPLGQLSGHKGDVLSVAFAPDGQRILTGSEDGTARVFSRDGEPIGVFDGGQDAVESAAFSPDGTTIATAGDDGTVHLWDARLETRSADEIERRVEQRVPYQLIGGKLVPVDLHPMPAPASSP
jgi:WD40 repeat protein